ncbi:MAG: hypothetical protein Q4G03_00275 [Planctomycetia bacterium]|nr:hypothetical protein [Planctomycetia bacterium]
MDKSVIHESFYSFPESNPFSTRFTAPGKTPFFFERSFLQHISVSKPDHYSEYVHQALGAGETLIESVCLQYLIDKLESNGRRGQILGANGSGKTTLMTVLKKKMLARGYEILSWNLNAQRRFQPEIFWLEMQRFLQTAPNFLPTRCLLPPPVVSMDDYRAIRHDVGANQTRQEQTNQNEQLESFQVSDDLLQRVNHVESSEAKYDNNAETPVGFRFNSEGSFGFSKTKNNGDADLNKQGDENQEAPKSAFKFAPFPAQDLDKIDVTLTQDDQDEVYDDVEIEEEQDEELFDHLKVNLDFPIPDVDALRKNRHFFDRKMVFFDGFDHLSYANRIVVRTFCRMNHLGLLITTHSPAIGVPVLYRTNACVETLGQLMNFLLDDSDMTPDDAQLEILLKNFKFDVREILFAMYDAFENYRVAPRELREKIMRRYPR